MNHIKGLPSKIIQKIGPEMVDFGIETRNGHSKYMIDTNKWLIFGGPLRNFETGLFEAKSWIKGGPHGS